MILDRRLVIAAVCALGFLSTGCARGPRQTAALLWNSVPVSPWSTADRKASDDKEAEKLPEAKVAANAAASTADAIADTDAAGGSKAPEIKVAEARARDKAERPSLFASLVPKFGSTDKPLEDPFLALQNQPAGPATEVPALGPDATVAQGKSTGAGGEPSLDSQLDRLRAVVTTEPRDETAHAAAALRRDETRVRVEAMMADARAELEAGRYADAQRIALTAQTLADRADLIFSPDEERPVDFAQRIRLSRDAERLASDGDGVRHIARRATSPLDLELVVAEKRHPVTPAIDPFMEPPVEPTTTRTGNRALPISDDLPDETMSFRRPSAAAAPTIQPEPADGLQLDMDAPAHDGTPQARANATAKLRTAPERARQTLSMEEPVRGPAPDMAMGDVGPAVSELKATLIADASDRSRLPVAVWRSDELQSPSVAASPVESVRLDDLAPAPPVVDFETDVYSHSAGVAVPPLRPLARPTLGGSDLVTALIGVLIGLAGLIGLRHWRRKRADG